MADTTRGDLYTCPKCGGIGLDEVEVCPCCGGSIVLVSSCSQPKKLGCARCGPMTEPLFPTSRRRRPTVPDSDAPDWITLHREAIRTRRTKCPICGAPLRPSDG